MPVCSRDPSLRLKDGSVRIAPTSEDDPRFGKTAPDCPDFRSQTADRAEVRLTCLSGRCLSSYLIFSASSSDKQAAVRFAGATLG